MLRGLWLVHNERLNGIANVAVDLGIGHGIDERKRGCHGILLKAIMQCKVRKLHTRPRSTCS